MVFFALVLFAKGSAAGRRRAMGSSRRARAQRRATRRRRTIRPWLGLFMKSPDPKGRLRVGNWIVQRLYNYTVNETVENRFLAFFQHVVDPAPVRAVADKNSCTTPLDLRPTVAD